MRHCLIAILGAICSLVMAPTLSAQCDCGAGAACASLDSSCTSSCGCGSCLDDRWYLLTQREGGLNVQGWVDAGFMGNTSSPNSRFNGPYNAVDRSNEGMLNQIYVFAEKALDPCCIGIGGRVDLMYGEDFLLAESIGIEKRQDGSAHWNGQYYGLAFPQAYATVGTQSMNLQVGHFYSVVGYEGVMAPDNFFYSKALSYQFAGPFTHWGAQANWNPNESLSLQLGVTNGWDAFDRVSDDPGFVGKIRYEDCCTGIWTSFAAVTGKEFNNGANRPINNAFTNRTRYSWLVGVPVTSRWEYVFHHWLGFQKDGKVGGGDANWYGIDQYLYYRINDCWKGGFRFEWFRDEDGTRVGLNRTRNPNNPPFQGNFYSASLGMNWTPTSNLTVRPEIRYDWFDGGAVRQPFADGQKDHQLLIGVDAILRF